MRVGAATLLAIGAIAALVAIGVTDQVLPASQARIEEVRPWIAARALGVTSYLLLAIQVGLGLVLSHPRNTAEWRKTKQVFPWHEMLTVFVWAFLILHIVLMAIDPWAKVGWLGAFVRPVLRDGNSLDMDAKSRLEIDPLGRLVGFESKVRLANIRDAIRMQLT